jgi:hypothetical protein
MHAVSRPVRPGTLTMLPVSRLNVPDCVTMTAVSKLDVEGFVEGASLTLTGPFLTLDFCLCVWPKMTFPGLYRALTVLEYGDTLTVRTLTMAFPGLLGRFQFCPGINLTAPCHIIDNEGALRMRSVPHKY